MGHSSPLGQSVSSGFGPFPLGTQYRVRILLAQRGQLCPLTMTWYLKCPRQACTAEGCLVFYMVVLATGVSRYTSRGKCWLIPVLSFWVVWVDGGLGPVRRQLISFCDIFAATWTGLHATRRTLHSSAYPSFLPL